MTDKMKAALALMADANVTLPQLSDGASEDAIVKLKEVGVTGDDVEKLEKQGLKLKEVEEALGGQESESTEGKLKSVGMPHLIEDLASKGVTAESVAKLETEGMDLEKIQKLMDEPLSEGLVKAMA